MSLNPGDVKHYPDASLYDPSVLRTFFITFENPAWESELVTFNNTDVDVLATVVVDGISYSMWEFTFEATPLSAWVMATSDP